MDGPAIITCYGVDAARGRLATLHSATCWFMSHLLITNPIADAEFRLSLTTHLKPIYLPLPHSHYISLPLMLLINPRAHANNSNNTLLATSHHPQLPQP